ncbi:hypothetical protein ADL25_37690 [Streptomyces sp. NRRL F-5122]|nr:hypothetical protein ADL25_37690 [Streptomyces sp. NRRL F-5122]
MSLVGVLRGADCDGEDLGEVVAVTQRQRLVKDDGARTTEGVRRAGMAEPGEVLVDVRLSRRALPGRGLMAPFTLEGGAPVCGQAGGGAQDASAVGAAQDVGQGAAVGLEDRVAGVAVLDVVQPLPGRPGQTESAACASRCGSASWGHRPAI